MADSMAVTKKIEDSSLKYLAMPEEVLKNNADMSEEHTN